MKNRFVLLLLASFCIFFGSPSQSQTPPTSAKKVVPAVVAEFEQPNASATPIRVKLAKRTEWYHDFSSELRATSPEKDAVLVFVLDGITPEQFQKISAKQPAEGIGSMYMQAGDVKRVFQITSYGTINGKPKIMLATTVPRSAAEVRIVIGDISPAVVRLKGPIVPEITSTD
jgi:hypothetical protein